jgi:hypothetical protein
MTLGVTPTGAIKIKTDEAGGGLRAVECACCRQRCGGCGPIAEALADANQIESNITSLNLNFLIEATKSRGYGVEPLTRNFEGNVIFEILDNCFNFVFYNYIDGAELYGFFIIELEIDPDGKCELGVFIDIVIDTVDQEMLGSCSGYLRIPLASVFGSHTTTTVPIYDDFGNGNCDQFIQVVYNFTIS